MRIGIVGAGAVGGYFGGRLVEKGEDVTFLVRSHRKEELERKGLIIRSSQGDVKIQPSLLLAGEKADPFDLIILSTKAYHLEDALSSIIPYMNTHSMVLPLLNGIRHLDFIQQKIGADAVLGGFCYIESTLTEEGEIHHLGDHHRLIYGELDGKKTDRILQLDRVFRGARFDAHRSDTILTEMWNKYIFISALSGMTTAMNTNIGAILSSDYGREIYQRLLHEICAIAAKQPLPKPAQSPEEIFARVETLNPQATSSMFRDRSRGLPIETNHFHKPLLQMGQKLGIDLPILKTIYTQLSLYKPHRNRVAESITK